MNTPCQSSPVLRSEYRRPGRHLRACAGTLALVASASFLGALPGAIAAEWSIAPDVRIGAHHNDNNRLTEGDEEISITGGFARVGALMRWRSPTSSVLLRPRVDTSKYPGDSEENADEQFFDLVARNQGLRSEWAVTGNFARERILRNEEPRLGFGDPEIDDPDIDNSGRSDVPVRRTLGRVRPSFAYEFTEKLQAGIRLSYLDVGYSSNTSIDLSDYTDTRAELFSLYSLTETSRIRTTVFASNYDVDSTGDETRSYGLRAGYLRDITDVYSVYVDVGGQYNDFKAGSGSAADDSSSGFLFDAGMQRRWERTDLRIAASHSVLPSGSGLRERDQLRLTLRRQFRPRWYGELAGTMAFSDDVDSGVDTNERDYYRLGLRAGYELTRALSVDLSYAFTFQDDKDEPGDAQSNEVFLVLRYQPRGQAWSW